MPTIRLLREIYNAFELSGQSSPRSDTEMCHISRWERDLYFEGMDFVPFNFTVLLKLLLLHESNS